MSIPASSVAATDQQYNAVKAVLDELIDGLRPQVAGSDEAVGWLGTVQRDIARAKKDPEYLDRIMQLAGAAFIRLAKQ